METSERAVSTAILLLCTVYSKFLLCLLFRLLCLLSESRLSFFIQNFASLVLLFSKVCCQWFHSAFNTSLNKQHDLPCSLRLSSFFISLFRHRLLLFKFNLTDHKIRIFKYDCLKSVHTVQIWSRSTELSFKLIICRLRKSQVCWFFYPCLTQKLIMITKTHKSVFILKKLII